MIYRITNAKNVGSKFKVMAFILVIISLISLFLMCSIQKTLNKEVKGNIMYVEILNYSMPIIKQTSFDTEDLVESKVSLKGKALELLGININNPINIMSKEISYFATVDYEGSVDMESRISFNPFSLEESSIFKKDTKDIENDKEGENTPSKAANVYDPKLKKTLNSAKPEVFIYHTHTTESYKPGDNDSFDEAKNVCSVGEELAKELEKGYGVSVVHDKTIHSTMYTQSYTRSRETLEKYLKKYGDFKLIIDLHRDSGTNKDAFTTKLNNEELAKFMVVMTKKNPHFNKNDAIAKEIVDVSNNLFPGLTRGVMYYNTGTRYFNQDKSNNAILIEVGANLNTTEEAKGTSKYLARIIAEYLKNKQ